MQRRPTKSAHVEQQLSLLPERKVLSRPENRDHIRLLTSTKEALEYGCQLAGVERKEIYSDMGCDKTTWSRILSGEFDIDGRDIPKLNKLLGNSAYLLYLCFADGWDLDSMHKAMSDVERENAELRKQLEEERRAFRLAIEYHQGRR